MDKNCVILTLCQQRAHREGADSLYLVDTKDEAHDAHDAAVKTRAGAVRERLRHLVEELAQDGRAAEGKRDVVVVTHGVFMKFLAEDETIDLLKAGWKAYTVGKQEGGHVTVVPVEQVEGG